MALPPLATQADAAAWGYTLPAETADLLLARASTRLRRAARESISAATITIETAVDCDEVALPAQPVISVSDVQAVADDGTLTPLTGWRWNGEALMLTSWPRPRRIQVTYLRGRTVVPDGVVELTCQVAVRMSLTPAGMDIGIRERRVDDYTEVYATEQIDAAGDLLPGERTALRDALGSRTVWVTGR